MRGRDTRILGVALVQDLSSGDVEVAEVLGLQAGNEHVVASANKQLFECFVGGHVLFEPLCSLLE